MPFALLAVLLIARHSGLSSLGQSGLAALAMGAVGTFLGAFTAFRLERRDRMRRDREREIQNGRRAQLALASQLVLLLNLRQVMVDPVEGDPNAWLSMSPVPLYVEPMLIDFSSLDSLLRPEAGRLIHDLVSAEYTFTHVWGMVKHRNLVHLDLQSRAARIGDKAALDASTVTILKSATRAILDGMRMAINRHSRLVERLGAALRRQYPGEKFMTIETTTLMDDEALMEHERSRGREV